MLANTSVEKPIKQNVHNIRNKRTRGSWSRFIIYQFLQFKLCFIFGVFLVFHLGNFVQGASLNHVDQFLDKFDPPSPLWTILLNKGYGLMWTFHEAPFPPQRSTLFKDAPLELIIYLLYVDLLNFLPSSDKFS